MKNFKSVLFAQALALIANLNTAAPGYEGYAGNYIRSGMVRRAGSMLTNAAVRCTSSAWMFMRYCSTNWQQYIQIDTNGFVHMQMPKIDKAVKIGNIITLPHKQLSKIKIDESNGMPYYYSEQALQSNYNSPMSHEQSLKLAKELEKLIFSEDAIRQITGLSTYEIKLIS